MENSNNLLSRTSAFLNEFFARFKVRSESEPIDTVEKLLEFVATRSAFVAQKTLYGYLKTRIGTRYPTMFEDETFVQSINIAKFHVFTACVSDLTIFAIGTALQDVGDPASKRSLALECFKSALEDNLEELPSDISTDEVLAAFEERIEGQDWSKEAIGRDNFTLSPKALCKWAPIAPNLKKYDTEIIENSVILNWFEIRQRFLKRVKPESISADATSRNLLLA